MLYPIELAVQIDYFFMGTIEPQTRRSEDRCSIQLSYKRICQACLFFLKTNFDVYEVVYCFGVYVLTFPNALYLLKSDRIFYFNHLVILPSYRFLYNLYLDSN